MNPNSTRIAHAAVCIVLLLALLTSSAWGAVAESFRFATKWGSGGAGDGQFSSPDGMAVDASGNVHVVDVLNHRIQKFTPDGAFLAKWGSGGFGDGQLFYASAVAVDSSGNVYVADAGNNRIQKLTSSGTFLAKWGWFGSADGLFSSPSAVALDSSGNVYVADTGNNRVQEFTSGGDFLTKWGTIGSGDGQLDRPAGVAVGPSGNVYVADTDNNRIQKFTSTGTFLGKWGSLGTGDGQFDGPRAVAVDASGNVCVTDEHNNRIQRFTSGGTFLSKWGSFGTGDGQLAGPRGVAVDSYGNVYVVDPGNCRIQKFERRGLRWVGTGDYVTDGVHPSLGNPIGAPKETTFTFKTKCLEYGVPPTLAKCMLRSRDSAGKWKVHKSLNMTLESGSPATAQVYSLSTKLPPGQWQYRFRYVIPAGSLPGPGASWTDGPLVITPPSLRWAGAPGFDGTDGVNPNSGAPGARFDFRVKYSQSEGRPPSTAVCELMRGGEIVKTLYLRSALYPTPSRVKKGLSYRAKERLGKAGAYQCRFRFHDGQGWATGAPAEWTSGPTVGGGVTLGLTSVAAVPTNAGAQVAFSLSAPGQVSARVLNLAGRPVKTLCHDRDLDAGANTLLWNARDDRGLAVPSGAYLVEVVARDDDHSHARAVTQLRISR